LRNKPTIKYISHYKAKANEIKVAVIALGVFLAEKENEATRRIMEMPS
jgi:hypothetical protein